MTTPFDALMSEVPQYTTTLPLSGEVVRYRPFLVREEKIFVIAADSDDVGQYKTAVEQVIFNTTFGKVDPTALAPVDLEWMLIELRKKSKGKDVEMTYVCDTKIITDDGETPCGHSIETSVSLDTIRFVNAETDSTIRLSETIGVKMHPARPSEHEDTIDGSIKHISDTIEMIYAGDEVWQAQDLSASDLKKFIEHLAEDQLEKLATYCVTVPRLELDVELRCPKCGSEDKIVLHGFQSFFE